MSEYTLGSIYNITHARKGTVAVKVCEESNDWVTGVLVDGRPKMMNPYNNINKGEPITLRKSLITLAEEVV